MAWHHNFFPWKTMGYSNTEFTSENTLPETNIAHENRPPQ